jgi:MFS family permease
MLTTEQKKIIVLSSLGGALEFYDFIIFVFFAKILSALFFPVIDKVAALIATFSVFAVGYFIRPLGGIVFGHFGDKLGRKKTFIATVLFMAIPTFLIGCLPTYQQVGLLAPLLLLFLRVLQGFSVGGEIPGALVFVSETAPVAHRGFACAIVFCGINFGLLLGSFVANLFMHYLSPQDLIQWGWRLPFLLGGLLGIVSFYLRKKMQETMLFQKMQQTQQHAKLPIKEVLHAFPDKIGKGMVLTAMGAALVSLLYLFMPTYLATFFNFSLEKVTTLNTIVIAIFCGQVLFMGYLADKYGYVKILRIGAVGLAFLSYPLYKLFGLQDFIVVIIVTACFSILGGFITSTFPMILVSLYPTRVRYSGVAFVYNLGFAIMGGLTPVLATSLIHWTNNLFVPGLWLAMLAMVTFIVSLFIRETRAMGLPD